LFFKKILDCLEELTLAGPQALTMGCHTSVCVYSHPYGKERKNFYEGWTSSKCGLYLFLVCIVSFSCSFCVYRLPQMFSWLTELIWNRQ